MSPKSTMAAFLYLLTFCLLLSGNFSSVHAAVPSTPLNRVVSSNDQPDTAGILASAYSSAIKIADPSQRYDSLIALAETALRVPDKKTAKKALDDAKVLFSKIDLQDYKFLKFIRLVLQADDTEGALASSQAGSGFSRITALGYVGEKMAQNGNISGAKKILQSVASMTESDIAPPPNGPNKIVYAAEFQPSLSKSVATAQCQIGIALATNNDLPDAASLLKSAHNNICIIDLLSAVASAEQKAGDIDASKKTLADIVAVVRTEAPKNNFNIEWVRRAAVAFGVNDDLVRAKAMIDSLGEVSGAYTEQQMRDLASTQVIESIAKNGDIFHASKMLDLLTENKRGDALLAIAEAQMQEGHSEDAHASLEAAYKAELSDAQADVAGMQDAADRATEFKRSEVIAGHVDLMVNIGKAMAHQGDIAYAKIILASAYTCVLYTHAPVNPSGMMMTVVSSQIEIGAFSDALITANKIEAINRMQFIIRLVNEEVKHADRQALSATVQAAVKTAQEAPPVAERGQADLAQTIASAGYIDEARMILASAQSNAQSSVGWQKMDQLAALKSAQVTMGDDAGMAKSAAQMQEETRQFDAEIARATADAQAKGLNQGNISGALLQMRQARAASNPDDAKTYMSKALEMVGNNSQLLETLMVIDARYHPLTGGLANPQTNMTATQLISRNDFPAASKQIDALTGRDRDAMLSRLGHAEAEAGQYKLAYATMNSIGDPTMQTSGLLQLIPQK